MQTSFPHLQIATNRSDPLESLACPILKSTRFVRLSAGEKPPSPLVCNLR